MKRLVVVLMVGLFLVVVAAVSRAAGVDVAAEKAAIAKVVDANIGWFATKDFDGLFRTMADDPDLFFFSPDSKGTVHGIEQFRKQSAIWRDPGSKYVSHEIRDLRIHVHTSGEVAWFSCVLDDCGEYGGKQGCWKDTRWTGVLEKRDGSWVIMQMHFSFAADQVRERVEKRLREEQGAVLHHLANEGFVVASGKQRVVVDFPYSGSFEWCYSPSDEQIEALLGGKGPFAGVDLFLFTHDHVDHFDPALLARALAANPNAAVVGTSRVIERLRQSGGDPITNRLIEAHVGQVIDWHGVQVEPLTAPHARYWDIDPGTGKQVIHDDGYIHVAYRVTMTGLSFVHGGDAHAITFPAGTKADLLMLDRGVVKSLGLPALKAMQQRLGARRTVLMHAGPAEKEAITRLVAPESDWLSALTGRDQVIPLSSSGK